MHVIATAGHVDHGKSTLVRALTGMEPDRWAEERRRGMTIDLGFAWTTLPTGETVAFVDVPGHERFVSNMLAGVGPAPAAMIVVAADEGWMPQSSEHLAALAALRVRDGLLVVTRSDLADPAPALAEATTQLASTPLGHVESVCVSGTTGVGLDALRAALGRLVAALPRPDADAPVRFWVDRAFTIRGAGTVVTGTLPAGRLRTGDELLLVPGGHRARIRSLESLKTHMDAVSAVARVAVNLRNVSVHDIRRGFALVTPDDWMTTAILDIRADDNLPREVLVHVGSASVAGRVRPFGSQLARLALARPLPLHIGDRLLLRDPGSRRIVGATTLDVRPPALTRRGSAGLRRRELAEMTGTPDATAELRRRKVVAVNELRAMGCPDAPGIQPIAGRWLLDPEHREELLARLVRDVGAHSILHPLEPGVTLDSACRALDVPDRRIVEALVGMPLVVREGRVLRADAWHVLPPDVTSAVEEVRRELAGAPFAALDTARLSALGLTATGLAAAVRTGALLRVDEGVYLGPDALDLAVRCLAALPQPFTVSEARQALGTTRRVAVPLLGLLDRTGRTRRLDDAHRSVVEPPQRS